MAGKFLAVFLIALVFNGCVAHTVERGLIDPRAFQVFGKGKTDSLKASSPFLKAHMKDGSLYVFNAWNNDGDDTRIAGEGVLYSPSRDTVMKGHLITELDSVSILETNVIRNSGAATAMTVFTGITAAITVYCITNPKACFGSCPTFYVSDGDSLRLQAEGFSSSIAPSMEATDVDALFRARPIDGSVTVEMRNEALETHVVHHVDLLAVPRHVGCRVFVDKENRFWESDSQMHPSSARGAEGDCLPAIWNVDGLERYSNADETDLATKETIDLQFCAHPGQPVGLVLGCRQSLLPTYLLYQAYAYMGNDAGHWLAEIERKNLRGKDGRMEELIGGIEASVRQPDGQWRNVGVVQEHGPLATDVHLLPLGMIHDSTISIKLRMTKGAWRIDYVALAELSDTLQPIRVHPAAVFKGNQEDENARIKLLGPKQHLVTFPGDRYTLKYELPIEQKEYELFLESRGYYLEWIREEWVKEENPYLLAEMIITPEYALKRLAPAFKQVEAQMEQCFWRSRYAKP